MPWRFSSTSRAASPNRVSIRMMDGAPDWEGYYSHYNKWRRGILNFSIDTEKAIGFSLLLEAPPTVLLQVSHFQLMIILINIHLDFRVWQPKMKALKGTELSKMNFQNNTVLMSELSILNNWWPSRSPLISSPREMFPLCPVLVAAWANRGDHDHNNYRVFI